MFTIDTFNLGSPLGEKSGLEPISKLPEQDCYRCKLNKAEEILGIIFPSNKETTLPLNPGKEPLNKPTPFIAAQTAAILGFAFLAVRAVWGDHLDAVFAEFLVELVTVIGTVAYQVLGLRFDHVEVKTELHESDLMVIRRMGAGG